MARKRRKRPPEEVNVGAFADIAFLLIVFFILTTTFIKLKGSQLQIPSGTTDPASKQDKHPTIHLRGETIRWGERKRPVPLAELTSILSAHGFPAQPEANRMVILNAAPDVPYQRYFEVVMAIHDAGGVLALVESEEGSP